jgi:hypothetical protein
MNGSPRSRASTEGAGERSAAQARRPRRVQGVGNQRAAREQCCRLTPAESAAAPTGEHRDDRVLLAHWRSVSLQSPGNGREIDRDR